ncbi:MAG: transketolase [Burkholderiaceae bacterium]
MVASPTFHPALPNAIRALAMDAVQQANSGHPGAPMGMADIATVLWQKHLRHHPEQPQWADRDRFVLSNGHGSMLLYALLHLSGYRLPMAELKRFRQLHSLTPGHPEVDVTPGVETTTGPLGQGLTNAVGMALAEKLLAAQFNRPGHAVVDHRTWVFLGDGCLMEGISHEACALAGAWRLNKLVAIYDDNGISIDGQVRPWFVDDTAARFAAYGWHVIGPINGHDMAAIDRALNDAKRSEKPVLVVCQTNIGQGSPNRVGTAKAHGEPLGAEEIALTRQALDWQAQPFEVPEAVARAWDGRARGAALHGEWQQRWQAYAKAYPDLAKELQRRWNAELPKALPATIKQALADAERKAEGVASRKASQMALGLLAKQLPELLGGSADLTGSNLTLTPDMTPLRMDLAGRVVNPSSQAPVHVNYGVREFGMAAIMNGVALHGGFIPYGGTFLTFSDYSRNALRMAALMKRRVVHVFTHDSIGLGEDGPTHQSIEHAASLRLIPGLDVWRPCDVAETLVAWHEALQATRRPSALLLSRQSLPHAPKAEPQAIARGGYVLAEPTEVGQSKLRAVLIATGSEVSLALRAQDLLAQRGIGVRVVSMPCTQAFDRQDIAYQQQVLPPHVPRVAVEMGSTSGWWKYGCAAVVGIDVFGESAPAADLFQHFGFTPENVADTVQVALAR